jgi:hypothetical protein
MKRRLKKTDNPTGSFHSTVVRRQINNFKKFILLVLLSFMAAAGYTVNRLVTEGSNTDPSPQTVRPIPYDIKLTTYIPSMDRAAPAVMGEMPYEMKDRQEEQPPFLIFEDCSGWIVESTGAAAFLNRSQDQRMFHHDSGELTYLATDTDSLITVRAKNPIVIPEPWDNLRIWIYGNSWQYGNVVGPLDMDIIILDADGNQSFHRVPSYNLGTINFKYWWLLRVKIHQEILRPAKLAGFRFSGKKITFPGNSETIYLGPIYACLEQLKPIPFEAFPENLPFPTRPETILPLNKEASFENTAEFRGERCVFTYRGSDCTLEYQVDPKEHSFDAISLIYNQKTVKPCAGGKPVIAAQNERGGPSEWKQAGQSLKDGLLRVSWNVTVGASRKVVYYQYYICQKSLIFEIKEDTSSGGIFEDIVLGRAENVRAPKLFRVPMLNFDYAQAPRLLYSDGLFFFTQFDWYCSQASLFYAKEFPVTENSAVFNGGSQYIPKTDGVRNPVRERLFINVSPNVQEVLPTIANPKSPMRAIMGDKAWMTINCGGMTHEDRLRIPRLYRNLGMEKVVVRYHEGTWRDGGESFTFRTDASPYQGGNEALKNMVSQVKSLGWLCGLYTNYTDFSPVNPNWNEDWLRLDQNGDWVSSWYSCYSVKPMIAWQEQMKYAPVIHRRYGTNHCYCDVHTAIPPFARVDYDSRVPGAATFRRTFEAYGLILLNERKAHKGPIYSEGGNHWWYAGLVDGNYANAFPSLAEQPLFVDFELLKIHPLEMDAGNVSYVFDEKMGKGNCHTPFTLAYGHICQLTPYSDVESMKRYYLIQPIQRYYVMTPVQSILYWNGSRFVDTSEALASDAHLRGQVHVEYQNGFKMWINVGQEDWSINVNGAPHVLPQNGFYASSADGLTMSCSVTVDSAEGTGQASRVDYAVGPDSYYMDTHGKLIDMGKIAACGSVALKKENAGWEIIPARNFETVGFDPTIIGLGDAAVAVEGINQEGLTIEQPELSCKDGKVWINRGLSKAFKYRITPAVNNSQR